VHHIELQNFLNAPRIDSLTQLGSLSAECWSFNWQTWKREHYPYITMQTGSNTFVLSWWTTG